MCTSGWHWPLSHYIVRASLKMKPGNRNTVKRLRQRALATSSVALHLAKPNTGHEGFEVVTSVNQCTWSISFPEIWMQLILELNKTDWIKESFILNFPDRHFLPRLCGTNFNSSISGLDNSHKGCIQIVSFGWGVEFENNNLSILFALKHISKHLLHLAHNSGTFFF